MAYQKDHCFMALQSVLYLIAATGAFCALVPIGVIKNNFNQHCMFYGEVKYNADGMLVVADWGSDSACSYICWMNSIILILGVFVGSYFMAMCCTGREAFGIEATCCSPFPTQITLHAVLTLTTFLAACFASAGLRHLCDTVKLSPNGYQCGHMEGAVWADERILDVEGHFYAFMHAVKSSCWFVFFVVIIIFAIYLARWYNEKLQHAVNEYRPIIDSTTL